jgi:hypothetical protein
MSLWNQLVLIDRDSNIVATWSLVSTVLVQTYHGNTVLSLFGSLIHCPAQRVYNPRSHLILQRFDLPSPPANYHSACH